VRKTAVMWLVWYLAAGLASILAFEMPAARRAEAVLEEVRGDKFGMLQAFYLKHNISPARSEGITRNKDRRTNQAK
jgi:hypothetical protein